MHDASIPRIVQSQSRDEHFGTFGKPILPHAGTSQRVDTDRTNRKGKRTRNGFDTPQLFWHTVRGEKKTLENASYSTILGAINYRYRFMYNLTLCTRAILRFIIYYFIIRVYISCAWVERGQIEYKCNEREGLSLENEITIDTPNEARCCVTRM